MIRTSTMIRRFFYKLGCMKWWFLHRFHPKHRYHVIHTGLEPGWYDRDFMLEVVMIKIFTDFIEKEKPFEDTPMENFQNPEEQIRINELYNILKDNNFRDMEREELTGYLIEIVKLRKNFWT